MRRQGIQAKVLEAVNRGVTNPTVIAAAYDIDVNNVFNYLNRLCAENKIIRVGRGKYVTRACALGEAWR